MSTYIMSDIHGQYMSYVKMLKKIEFNDDDYLYILGDVIDRGPDGIRVIKDVMKRDNAELILGNHEFMLLNALEYLRVREYNGRIKRTDDGLNPLELWTHPCNGGEGTCLEFINLPKDEQDSIEAFLKSCSLIKRVKIAGRMCHLSHSYSLNKKFGRECKLAKASHKAAERIVWESVFDRLQDDEEEIAFAYPEDKYYVGHIFTQRLGRMDEKGHGLIYSSEDYRGIDITDVDCGMALNSRSSRLGCICVETGEEFYVPLLEE